MNLILYISLDPYWLGVIEYSLLPLSPHSSLLQTALELGRAPLGGSQKNPRDFPDRLWEGLEAQVTGEHKAVTSTRRMPWCGCVGALFGDQSRAGGSGVPAYGTAQPSPAGTGRAPAVTNTTCMMHTTDTGNSEFLGRKEAWAKQAMFYELLSVSQGCSSFYVP